MDFKVTRMIFTERPVPFTERQLKVVPSPLINPERTVTSVGLASQPTHSEAETFVELGVISKRSQADFLPLCDVASPWNVGPDYRVPQCSGPLWMFHYTFHPPPPPSLPSPFFPLSPPHTLQYLHCPFLIHMANP